MSTQSFTTTFMVEKPKEKVFTHIANLRGWWSEEIQGHTDKVNETFQYHFKDAHRATIKTIEFTPNEKIVWHIVENYFNFTKDTSEWTGTDLIFSLTEEDGKTTVTFTHEGLVQEYECYDICSSAWKTYVNGSLKAYIETGVGSPNSSTKPQTETEEKIVKQG